MKKSIKNSVMKFGLVLFLMMLSISGRAQVYTMSMTATAPTDRTIEVTLIVTANSNQRFAGFSAGVNFNTAIVNGGTLSVAYVPNSKAAELSALSPSAVALSSLGGQMRLPNAVVGGASSIDMVAGSSLVLGTYRITNTVPWKANENASLWLQNVLATQRTNTSASGYPYGATTPQTVYNTTAPTAGALVLGYTAASPLSLVLNAPSCPTAVAASNLVAESPCAGAANGSALITLTGAPNNSAAITYKVDGGADQNATLSGGAFTVSGLSAGSHTVTVTYPTCEALTTSSFTIGSGAALVTPTVSLSSSDADNTFAYGTGVTFTASASNLSGGTATYTFTVNGQTVQSGSSNTYTSSTLANANQVRASISISGGSCLTATTANSNIITNTVTGAVLTNITNFCGLTMPAIDSRIKCAVPSGVVGTLGYRFRVTNLTTNATATVDSNIANFNLTMTNIYAFGTSFSVQAAAVVNGVLQPYSAPCTITTPSLPTNQLVATSCGQTLESLNTRIFASTVVGAQNYRWRVALSSAPTTYYELVTTSSSFRLTNVPNLPVSFGNTYLVAVQSDILVNGIATTTAYGTVCSVSTPSVNVVSISANQCGQTLAGITDRIFINSVPNAVNYTYRVRKVGTADSYTFTTTATSFRLTSFTGLSLTFDSQYYVAVAASIVIDGTTFNAPFGPDCTISTPAYPTVGLQESQCSNGDPENPGAYQVTSSSELIYCEFVSGASYQFILQKLVNGTPQGSPVTLDRLGNFFTLSMVHGLEAGTEYLVSVKLFYYGEGPEGKDCVIRTPNAVSATRVAAKEFAATAYPNPFENNFLVDLTTSSQAPVSLKVYDMLGRLMTSYESKSKDLSTIAIGDQFPSGVYNVVVTQGDEVRTLRVVKR
jgi:hypothetical protein